MVDMSMTTERKTIAGVGYATLPDAFQCGREAAQTAKRQFPEGSLDLVLVFAPEGIRFNDFIEGVRLVTGESTLVGIPTSHVITTELQRPEGCFVLILQCPYTQFSLASAVKGMSSQSVTTALLTQFRNARGNAIHQFANRGVILFNQGFDDVQSELAEQVAGDLGLESWILGASPSLDHHKNPLICQNKTISEGLVGIECLSQVPWGITSVGLSSFPDAANLHQEAGKAAMRESLAKIKPYDASMAVLFFGFPVKKDPALLRAMFDGASSVFPALPIVGIQTNNFFLRSSHQSLSLQHDAVTAMVIP